MSVETKETAPAPPHAADDAEALRLAVRGAVARALGDCEGEDVRDAVADVLARRDDKTEAEAERLGEREMLGVALLVGDGVRERDGVLLGEGEPLAAAVTDTEALVVQFVESTSETRPAECSE